MRGREGRDRGDSGRPKKKGRRGGMEIDPLDPTGKTGGKWSDGLVQVRSAMLLVVDRKSGISINHHWRMSKLDELSDIEV